MYWRVNVCVLGAASTPRAVVSRKHSWARGWWAHSAASHGQVSPTQDIVWLQSSCQSPTWSSYPSPDMSCFKARLHAKLTKVQSSCKPTGKKNNLLQSFSFALALPGPCCWASLWLLADLMPLSFLLDFKGYCAGKRRTAMLPGALLPAKYLSVAQ